VSKGEVTRNAILERATALASRSGLAGVTIGRLAEELGMSKSGLFSHFSSKEGLELAILEFAAARFVDAVIKPALAAPRGEPRVRALFEGWQDWPDRSGLPGGCLFVAAAAELDDRPGEARDRLAAMQRDWLETIATVVRTGITEGHFRKDLDAEQLAHDLYGVMLVAHHTSRLLRDPRSRERTVRAFEALVAAARKRAAA
jgi:AcrR family transcriptional regulator